MLPPALVGEKDSVPDNSQVKATKKKKRRSFRKQGIAMKKEKIKP